MARKTKQHFKRQSKFVDRIEKSFYYTICDSVYVVYKDMRPFKFYKYSYRCKHYKTVSGGPGFNPCLRPRHTRDVNNWYQWFPYLALNNKREPLALSKFSKIKLQNNKNTIFEGLMEGWLCQISALVQHRRNKHNTLSDKNFERFIFAHYLSEF